MNKIINSFFRITASGKYIPEIDGIRFIAIISVLLFHAAIFYLFKAPLKHPDILNQFFSNGYLGVYLFFVLSGYILSVPFAKLFSTENPDTKLVLKRYYVRRLTRLEPPYIIALVFFFIMLVFGTHKYTFDYLFPHLISSLFYLSNIVFGKSPGINVVLWTLEIEVQFYLLAPLLCFFVFHNKISHLRRSLYLGAAIIVFAVLQWYITLPFRCLWQYFNFFLSGIVLTEILAIKKINLMISKFKNLASIILLLIIFYIEYNKTGLPYHILFSFLIIMLYLLILKYKSLNSFCTNKYICIIGGACYSIYLIHYQVISAIGNPLLKYQFSKVTLLDECIHIFIYLTGVLIVSMVFYKLFERPFMDKTWPDKLRLYSKRLLGRFSS